MFSTGYITYALVAVGIFTVYMAMIHLLRGNRMQDRVKNVTAGAAIESGAVDEAPPAMAQTGDRLLAALGISRKGQKELAFKLARAGITSPYAVTYVQCCQWLLQPPVFILGLFVMFTLLNHDKSDPLPHGIFAVHLLFGLLLLIFGGMGTRMYIANRKQRRQTILTESFPEMLDLLMVCIESGLGLDAALNRVCRELRSMHPAVSAELERTRLELNMLGDRAQALQNLADRIDIVPYKALVAALIQTEKFGTSLVDTLRVLSEEQRLARLYSIEQKAARIPVLITIPLIIFIMPAFIMIIIAPPFIKVVEQGTFSHLKLPVPKK